MNIFYRKPLGRSNLDPIEKEANCFAANLLVPKFMLEKYIPDYVSGKISIKELSLIFEVSADVMGYRLHDLKIKPMS